MTPYHRHSALVVVDVQNDFTDPEGSLYVRSAEDIVAAINTEVDQALAAEAVVIYTQDWHPDATPHFVTGGGIWPVHCVRDSWGAEFYPGLTVNGTVVKKGTGDEDGYSGFSGHDLSSGGVSETELNSILTERGVNNLVVVGVAGDYCVKATALDAVALGYEVSVPLATTRFVELAAGDTQAAIEAMREAGINVD